jgi:hypothetical protein
MAGPSMGVLLLSGFYMMSVAWGGAAWILVALGATVVMAVIGATLPGRRLGAIGQEISTENGPLSAELRERLFDSRLLTSLQVRTAIGLSIVFLMTVKPELPLALLTVGLAAVVGLAPTLLGRRGAGDEMRERERVAS